MDFRKRGPSAFKPKIPAARSRAAARSPAVTSARAVDSPAPDSTTSGPSESSHDPAATKAPIPSETPITGSIDVFDSSRDSGAPSTSTPRTAGDSESIIREAQHVAKPSSPVPSTKPSPRSARPTGSTETRLTRRASSIASAASSHQNETAAEEQREARVLEAPTSTVPPSRQNAVASSSRASTRHRAPGTRVAAPATSSATPQEMTGSSKNGALTNGAASLDAQTEQSTGRKGKRGASSRAVEVLIEERTVTPDDAVNVNPPKKRGRKPKQASSGEKRARSGKNKEADAPQPEEESDHGEAMANGDEKVVKKRKKRERARSVTPDDAEEQMIDHQTLKMSDLTRDLHIGRKFSRHDELRERERNRRRKKPADATQEDGNGTATEGQAPAAASEAPALNFNSIDHGLETPATASGPQFQIIDGQIVVDQNSLVMDRHARVRAADGELEEIEENDFTRLTTSASYQSGSKLKGPNHWNEVETDKFYRALRMFGTDFEIISKMFPGKNRRHIKMKFNREEKHRPRRITAALVGEKSVVIDLEEFEVHTGEKLDSMESIKTELRKNEEEWTEKYESTRRAHEEDMSRKKAELFGEQQQGRNGGGGGDEAEGADAPELDAAATAARANIVLEDGEELVEVIGDEPVALEPQPAAGRRGRKKAARGKGARRGLVDMTL